MERPNTESALLAAARAAYETNRAFCVSIGDHSLLPWKEAPQLNRDSFLKGADNVLKGIMPKRLHEKWLEEQLADGWKFGTVKDDDKKENPLMIAYHELPWEERAKDTLMVTVVLAMVTALKGLV